MTRRDKRRRPGGGRSEDRVAIVGMACVFPGAPDVATYWRNILAGKDCITDPPSGSWDVDTLYDPGARAPDRIYCKRGGYLGELARFDPLEHGVPPVATKGGEPEQWLALAVARRAFADAGLADGAPDPHRTAVILGKGDYVNRGNLSVLQHSGFVDQTLDVVRQLNPELTEDDLRRIRADLRRELPPFDADTVSGLVPNIAAGRIANRLDLMGPSYTVDAACASSLIATDIAVRELRAGRCDLALVGGMHVVLPMQIRQVFCQLGALSPLERIRPFDESADGTILGEGVGMAVLQRLDDAEREGRRVYAVLRGVGTASDGHGASVMAPRLEGEILALTRAYEETGIDPRTVGLVEAHGTGTPVGDDIELTALSQVFGEREGLFPRCGLGAVKSMIGHLMPAAGMAALIKASLALHHRILPPTINVETPREALRSDSTIFYLNTEPRPWIRGAVDVPRRAGVNAFGFGGINAHAILEEAPATDESAVTSGFPDWDAEAVVLAGADRAGLLARVDEVLAFLAARPDARLADVAYSLAGSLDAGPARLGVVATSIEDLAKKLERARSKLADPKVRQIKNVRGGVYYFEEPLAATGKTGFLFPGEGSQYVGMLADLCLRFPEVRQRFEVAERGFHRANLDERPSDCFFPPPGSGDAQREYAKGWLWEMRGAVTAVLTGDWSHLTILRELEIEPDALVGHSTGEFPALVASGMIDDAEARADDFAAELHELFHSLQESESGIQEAGLVAVGGDSAKVAEVIAELGGGLQIAMDNCPHQSVVCGPPDKVEEATRRLRSRGLICETLGFDRPYHTSDFQPFAERMEAFVGRWLTAPPSVPTYSCGIKDRFPEDIASARRVAVDQWVLPVAFRETIEKMYEDGIRVFVEVGTRGNLCAFVDDILRGRPHVAVPADLENRTGTTQLCHLVATLAAHGVPMKLDALYERRAPRRLDVARPEAAEAEAAPRRDKLETGWPVMRLSDETLAALRARRAVPPAAASEAPASPAAAEAPPAATGAAAPAGSGARDVVAAHMKTMQRFLELNESVMKRYLAGSGRRGGASPAAPGAERAARGASRAADPATSRPDPAAAAAALPMLGDVVSLEPGREAVVRCTLDPRDNGFLRHHTFGRRVAKLEPDLLGVPVLPFTCSMELMAEAASLLVPEGRLIGLSDVRGFRWVTPGDGPLELRVVARREDGAPDGRVAVKILEAGDGAAPSPVEIPLVEGTVSFGTPRPAPRAADSFPLSGEHPSGWPPDRLYEEVMFHDPGMQGVRSLDALGDDGAVATLEVIPRDELFRGTTEPRFLTDPVLLDQAGQVVGFWAKDRFVHDLFFPFHAEEVELFDGPPPVGETLTCRARTEVLEGDQVRAALEVVRGDGRLWMRCRGWSDRRFPMPNRLIAFFLSPPEHMLSEPYPVPAVAGEETVARVLRRDAFPPDFFTGAGGMWQRSMASAILSRRERELFAREIRIRPIPERVTWLLERAVAKDAVREYLKSRHGLDLCSADVEVSVVPGGVEVGGAFADRVPSVPRVTVHGADGVFVALADEPGDGDPMSIVIEAVEQARRV